MGFGRCSADVKKGGSPLGQKVARATAALSKNLFDHVGAISNRSISPGYKQVRLWFQALSVVFLQVFNVFFSLVFNEFGSLLCHHFASLFDIRLQ
jgi:hypothetical protein